jgi:ABC-type branched-subunit amino acid transport system ATPase component
MSQASELELKYEDEDVRQERSRVDTMMAMIHEDSLLRSDTPLILSHMRKVYPSRGGLGPKAAVKDVTFASKAGSILGLLGPNGAGKSSLISMLTGLYAPTSGTARMAGYDLRTEIDAVYKVIGVCPQFDILWEDLTVGEHLYFYVRATFFPCRSVGFFTHFEYKLGSDERRPCF